MQEIFRSIPTDYPCHVVNQELWRAFLRAYLYSTGREPVTVWTEAEVVQWMDTNAAINGDQDKTFGTLAH